MSDAEKTLIEQARDILAADLKAVGEQLSELHHILRAGNKSAIRKATRTLSNGFLQPSDAARSRKQASVALSKAIDRNQDRIADGIKGLFEVLLAQSLVHSLGGEHSSGRGNASKAPSVSVEGMTLLEALGQRGVTRSMLDQLAETELDFLAQLFLHKVVDYRHRRETLKSEKNVWLQIVRAGVVDISLDGLNDDEKEAVRLGTSADLEAEAMAVRFFNKLAGRPLAISPQFARALLDHIVEGWEEARGLRLTTNRLTRADEKRDADLILHALGLHSAREAWARYHEILYPQIREMRHQLEQKKAAFDADVARHMPAAKELYRIMLAEREASDPVVDAAGDDYSNEEILQFDRFFREQSSISLSGAPHDKSQEFDHARKRIVEFEIRNLAEALVSEPMWRIRASERDVELPDSLDHRMMARLEMLTQINRILEAEDTVESPQSGPNTLDPEGHSTSARHAATISDHSVSESPVASSEGASQSTSEEAPQTWIPFLEIARQIYQKEGRGWEKAIWDTLPLKHGYGREELIYVTRHDNDWMLLNGRPPMFDEFSAAVQTGRDEQFFAEEHERRTQKLAQTLAKSRDERDRYRSRGYDVPR